MKTTFACDRHDGSLKMHSCRRLGLVNRFARAASPAFAVRSGLRKVSYAMYGWIPSRTR